MRVLIVGDVHGRYQALCDCLRRAVADFRIGAAIQVGDFGLRKNMLPGSRQRGFRFPVPLHVVDGNHEDHAWLHRALLAGFDRQWRDELNLVYQPRASVTAFGSSKVGFLGGALHVDRPQYSPASGMPNYILRRNREHAAMLFNEHATDLIVTHSCPAGIGIGRRASPEMDHLAAANIHAAGFEAGPREDCGETELKLLWQALVRHPRAWVYGHFHRFHRTTVGATLFVGMDDDLESLDRTLVIWDTEERRLLFCPADPSAG